MIEGLKITIPGTEVKRLLEEKAAHHQQRAADYQKTFETLLAALGPITEEDAPKMSSMSRDPRKDAEDGVKRHSENAKENAFLAQWVDISAMFLLDTSDLHRLGVLSSRY